MIWEILFERGFQSDCKNDEDEGLVSSARGEGKTEDVIEPKPNTMNTIATGLLKH